MRLKRRGNSYVGLCPFHQEKTPSFHVVPHKHLYHCFGCNAGGDAYKFLMELEGLSFMEAVKELSQATGVDLPERELTPEDRRRLRQKASLYEALDAACRFFQAVLMTHPDGQPGRDYLQQRGISRDAAVRWRLGYAPAGWTTTMDQLQQRGFPVELLLAAGLVKRKERDGGRVSHYDTFRDRVTIPITDTRGRVLAFGARLLEGDGPKYLNSPETSLYRKSSVLYGLEHARQAIQRADRALLVEGYFDVISMHEAGFEEVVATCGTALTGEHLETLRRLTGNVVALFDADEAGGRAAERSLPLFFEAGVLPWRLEVPGAKDPDELVREEGPQAMETALTRVEPLLEWVVERRLARSGGGAAAREAQVEDLVQLLSFTEGTDIVASVARRLRVHVDTLLDRVARARRERTRGHRPPRDPMAFDGPPPPEPPPGFVDEDGAEPDPGPPPPTHAPWRPTRDVVHLLWLLVHRYERVAPLAARLGPPIWASDPVVAPVLDALAEGTAAVSILDDVDHPDVRRTLNAVVARTTLYTEAQAALGMAQALHRLLQPQVTSRLDALDAQARAAVRARDWESQGRATSASLTLRAHLKATKEALNARNFDTFTDVVLATLADLHPTETMPELSTPTGEG